MWIDSYIYIQYTADLQQDMEGTWGLFVFPLSQGFNKISWRAMWFFDNALKDLIKFANSDSKVKHPWLSGMHCSTLSCILDFLFLCETLHIE